MKGKSRRTQMRHEVSDYGKVDRAVQKSFNKEASHKLETSEYSNGFFTAIKKMIARISGFFKKRQPVHRGVSTKSYCTKFGGASGGSIKKRKRYSNKGRPGVKLAKKLTVHIPSKGII